MSEAPWARPSESIGIVSLWGVVLLVGLLLVLVFLSASYVLVRTSRRAKGALLRKRRVPTRTDDLWAAHKLPPGAVDEVVEFLEHQS